MKTLNVVAVCSPRGMSPLLGPGRLDILYAPISPFKKSTQEDRTCQERCCIHITKEHICIPSNLQLLLPAFPYILHSVYKCILYQSTHCLSIISLLSVSLAYWYQQICKANNYCCAGFGLWWLRYLLVVFFKAHTVIQYRQNVV